MKKNNFVEGAMIATIGIIVCKILGLLYVIPFYSIIGTKGGALYSYAYSIYAIFLSLSTCGIPVAISKIISEYNTLGYNYIKNKAYKIGSIIMTSLGLISFLLLFIFADKIAYLIIGGVEGGNSLTSVATAIRTISIALLIVPQISVLRGYLQGHKIITPTSISEVVEQVVRVLVIVLGSFFTVKVFHLPINMAVYIAVLSATFGALSSYVYLKIKMRKNKDLLMTDEISEKEKKITTKIIFKKLIFYALPFVMIDLIRSAIGLVDSVTVVKTMTALGYTADVAETTFGVIATWGTKLNMIIISISLGLTVSLVPNISSSYVKKDMKDVNKKINQAIQMLLFITIPMAVGISFLARPVWVVFYGYDALSIQIFRFFILQVVFFSLYTIIINIAQSMSDSKIALIALIISFLAKASLNIPIMYLCEYIGIKAYYGSVLTNAIVEFGTFLAVILLLKRKHNFSYKDSLKTFIKTMVCIIFMVIGLYLLTFVINIDTISRLNSLLKVFIYGVIGSIIYLIIACKLNLFEDVFGLSFKNLLKKLKR